MAAKTKIVHVAVEANIKRQIEELAKHSQCSTAAIVRQALVSFLQAKTLKSEAA